MTVYLHLILAQVENLEEMEELEIEPNSLVPLNRAVYNITNILNTKCILAKIQQLTHLKK